MEGRNSCGMSHEAVGGRMKAAPNYIGPIYRNLKEGGGWLEKVCHLPASLIDCL